jgi:hypothetical protein
MGGSVQEFRVSGPGDGRESAGPSVLTPPVGAPAAGLAIPGQRQVPPSPPVGLSGTGCPPVRREPAVVIDPCRCGHGREAHLHYRPGTDCGACDARDCAGFRPIDGRVRRGCGGFSRAGSP